MGSLNNAVDQDYNYNINLDFAGSGENMIDNSGIIASSDVKASSGIIGGTGGVVGKNVTNPLLASVQTQGSLKADAVAQNINIRNRGTGAKGSGLSKGSHNGSAINVGKDKPGPQNNMQSRTGVNDMVGGQHTNNSNNRVGSINSNPGSTASRGSKYNIHHGQSHQLAGMQNANNLYNHGSNSNAQQNSQSPPSVRNKIHMHKIMKNSNSKAQNTQGKAGKVGGHHQGATHQYTMYQSNHMPMTSQQSRRKSQVSINNMMINQGNPGGANVLMH